MATTTAFVKASRLRATVRRHPWIYSDSVSRVEGDYEQGDAVMVRAPDGKFLAHGFINDASQLRLRLVSFNKKEPIDEALLRARVRDALGLRESLGLPARTDAYRVIHSEGDGFPGLIVDRYGEYLTYTCSSLGMHRHLEPVLDELVERLSPQGVIELGKAEGLRGKEGLPEGRGVVRGAAPEENPLVTIDGLKLAVPLLGGQKTGMYLDQRENVRRVAALSPGKRVLDACCYVGAFGLACAQAGASESVLFDSSADAVALAEQNAELNGLTVTARRASLFRELRRLVDAEETFEVVVLDPPKFASRARMVAKARKGYLDANLLALRLLAPGGFLLTCSCSGHFGVEPLLSVLKEASTRSGLDLRIVEVRGAGPDHPVDVHCPEGRYLAAVLVQRRGS